jgi:uncharacterized membrane protein required for colicin V production
MTFFISLIIAILFGLWGYKKGLFAVWPFAFNTVLAVYFGIMLTPTILDMAGQYLKPLGTSASVIVMFTVAFIYFVMAQLISFVYLTKTFCISLPRLLDIIGGAILAFLGGLLIANFMFFTIAVSPFKDISYISKYLPADMENSSRRHIFKACEFVANCSLQYEDKQILTAIEVVSRSADNKPLIPAETKPAEPKAKPKQVESSGPASKQHKQTIPEINE